MTGNFCHCVLQGVLLFSTPILWPCFGQQCHLLRG